MSKDGKDNDNCNEYVFRHVVKKTVFNDKFLKIKMFIVMEITLRQKYRWHATTGEYILLIVTLGKCLYSLLS